MVFIRYYETVGVNLWWAWSRRLLTTCIDNCDVLHDITVNVLSSTCRLCTLTDLHRRSQPPLESLCCILPFCASAFHCDVWDASCEGQKVHLTNTGHFRATNTTTPCLFIEEHMVQRLGQAGWGSMDEPSLLPVQRVSPHITSIWLY